jgi:hypothetical protein
VQQATLLNSPQKISNKTIKTPGNNSGAERTPGNNSGAERTPGNNSGAERTPGNNSGAERGKNPAQRPSLKTQKL